MRRHARRFDGFSFFAFLSLLPWPAAETDALAANLMQMEVDRILFLLRSYLRTRLSKIERFAVYVLQVWRCMPVCLRLCVVG